MQCIGKGQMGRRNPHCSSKERGWQSFLPTRSLSRGIFRRLYRSLLHHEQRAPIPKLYGKEAIEGFCSSIENCAIKFDRNIFCSNMKGVFFF